MCKEKYVDIDKDMEMNMDMDPDMDMDMDIGMVTNIATDTGTDIDMGTECWIYLGQDTFPKNRMSDIRYQKKF
jgi:hypothetical protein